MAKLFLLVTNDKYELPLTIPTTAKKLAEQLGIKESSVLYYSYPAWERKQAKFSRNTKKTRKPYKRKPYKIVCVKMDDNDDEDLENDKMEPKRG